MFVNPHAIMPLRAIRHLRVALMIYVRYQYPRLYSGSAANAFMVQIKRVVSPLSEPFFATEQPQIEQLRIGKIS